jgi:hypothetical protein
MLFSNLALAILGSAVVAECASINVGHSHMALHRAQNINRRTPTRVFRRVTNSTATCLDPSVIATGSALTGQEAGTAGIAVGQAPSAT